MLTHHFFRFIVVIVLIFSLTSSSAKTVKLSKNHHEKNGSRFTSYGTIENGHIIVKNAVKPNEFLSNVFSKFAITNDKALAVSSFNDTIFDAKRFRSGNKYAFVLNIKDKSLAPQKFIYEKNVIEYAVFDFDNDSIKGTVLEKPIEIRSDTLAASIKGSIYKTLLNKDINPLLALELADIFKWTIDFYRIQEGDFFKVIYEEEFVEGNSIGEFNVSAVNFNHMGKDHFAFFYIREGGQRLEYFDEEGNTLKQLFLQAPVAYSRISSPYSKNRFHPVTKRNKPHLGTDYAAPTGTPIYATANGVITHARYAKYNGNYVKIKHNKTYTTQYLHMSKIAKGIKPGVYVQQGQVIGYVGSTGLATGPHVCYRFWKNGKQVDPYREVLPKADPLPAEEITTYKDHIKELKQTINNLTVLTL